MSNTAVISAEEAAGESVVVFCQNDDVTAFEDAFRRLGRPAAIVRTGGPKEAAAWCAANAAPAILIVDVSRNAHPSARLAELGTMTGPGCRLVALGKKQDVNLYRKLLQAGVFDYLLTPLQLDQLSDTLNRADEDLWLGQPQPLSVRAGQSVAVIGASGGVGASTIVTALGQQFANVCKIPSVLVDYDRRASNLALMLGLEANSGLDGILQASEIDFRLIQRTLLVQEGGKGEPSRLQLLAQHPGAETPVDPDLILQLGGALCQLFSISIWDFPSHRPSGSDEILANSDIRIIVTDYTLQNARATHMLLSDFGDESTGQRLFLVANAARHRDKPAIGRRQFEEFLGRRVDFELPHAGTALDKSLLEGQLNLAKAALFRDGIESLAFAILGRPMVKDTKPNLFQRLRESVKRR